MDILMRLLVVYLAAATICVFCSGCSIRVYWPWQTEYTETQTTQQAQAMRAKMQPTKQ